MLPPGGPPLGFAPIPGQSFGFQPLPGQEAVGFDPLGPSNPEAGFAAVMAGSGYNPSWLGSMGGGPRLPQQTPGPGARLEGQQDPGRPGFSNPWEGMGGPAEFTPTESQLKMMKQGLGPMFGPAAPFVSLAMRERQWDPGAAQGSFDAIMNALGGDSVAWNPDLSIAGNVAAATGLNLDPTDLWTLRKVGDGHTSALGPQYGWGGAMHGGSAWWAEQTRPDNMTAGSILDEYNGW